MLMGGIGGGFVFPADESHFAVILKLVTDMTEKHRWGFAGLMVSHGESIVVDRERFRGSVGLSWK
jgi:hypothetical protein